MVVESSERVCVCHFSRGDVRRRETGEDERRETVGDGRRETGDGRRETGDGRTGGRWWQLHGRKKNARHGLGGMRSVMLIRHAWSWVDQMVMKVGGAKGRRVVADGRRWETGDGGRREMVGDGRREGRREMAVTHTAMSPASGCDGGTCDGSGAGSTVRLAIWM